METLDLRPPAASKNVMDRGAVLPGGFRCLGASQAGLMHGIQGEHEKLVGVFLLVLVEGRGQHLGGLHGIPRVGVEETLGHVSFHSTHLTALRGTTGLRVLPGQHVVGKRWCVCQALQGCVQVAAVARVLEPGTRALGPLPTRTVLAIGRRLLCHLSYILRLQLWAAWRTRGWICYGTRTQKGLGACQWPNPSTLDSIVGNLT